MEIIRKKPHNYKWTKELCQIEALKYNTRNDMLKNNGSAYHSIIKNNWQDELLNHMELQGNLLFRFVYVYLFSDNYFYVGLSCNIKKRDSDHKNKENSMVFQHIKKTGETPKLFIITPKPILGVEASKLESDMIIHYEAAGGIKLNISKGGGGLGGGKLIWTKDNCLLEALKYKDKTSFQIKSSGAYTAACSNKWLGEICSHMIEIQKPSGYWTKENCRLEAIKYIKKSDFKKNSGTAYYKSIKFNWSNEICSHMIEVKKPNGYWNKERCILEALKYNNKSEFAKHSATALNVIIKKGWLSEICSHMTKNKTRP